MKGPQFENFGALLYMLRATYAQRLSRKEHGTPVRNIRKSQQDVITFLRDKGYQISPGMFSEIENGQNYPGNAERFLELVSEYLELDEREEDELRLMLTYDIVTQRLGKRIADNIFERLWTSSD